MRPVDLTGRPLGICKVATRYRVNPCPAPSFFPPIFFLLSTSFPPRPGQVSTAIFATKTATSARNKLNCDSREGTDGKGGRSLDHFAARTAGKKCIVSLSRPRLSTQKRVSLGLYSSIKTERLETRRCCERRVEEYRSFKVVVRETSLSILFNIFFP